MTHLVSITLHRASFGLVVRDGVGIDAAPSLAASAWAATPAPWWQRICDAGRGWR